MKKSLILLVLVIGLMSFISPVPYPCHAYDLGPCTHRHHINDIGPCTHFDVWGNRIHSGDLYPCNHWIHSNDVYPCSHICY